MEAEAAEFRRCFDGLAAIGRAEGGGWSRLAWTDEDRAARAWFTAEAQQRRLEVEADRNGNLWAWWRPAGARGPAVVTGSHLDTVPRGGAYDGALGVVSGLLAVTRLQASPVPAARPVAVVAFADEEGARYNLPTFGSRLLTGALDPAQVLHRRDAAGVRLADALAAAEVDPEGIGADPQRLSQVAAFVELHVEQGRGLVDIGAPVAVGTSIWPHGRWRIDLVGEANHAGTTRLSDRRDPAVVMAAAVTGARAAAERAAAVATVGRVALEPNGANSVAARATAWLDARAPDAVALDGLVRDCLDGTSAAAAREGVEMSVAQESASAGVDLDARLRAEMQACLDRSGRRWAPLPTAAGHDAGALAGSVASGMLFVRNPTGISHSPDERADDVDCLAGIDALTAVLASLAGAG